MAIFELFFHVFNVFDASNVQLEKPKVKRKAKIVLCMTCFFGIGGSKVLQLTCFATLVPQKVLELPVFAQIGGLDVLELTCQPMHVGRSCWNCQFSHKIHRINGLIVSFVECGISIVAGSEKRHLLWWRWACVHLPEVIREEECLRGIFGCLVFLSLHWNMQLQPPLAYRCSKKGISEETPFKCFKNNGRLHLHNLAHKGLVAVGYAKRICALF